MKPSDFQKTIQCQFDCKLKKVVKGIVRNYRKELAREKAGLSRNDLGDKVFYGERHIADIENIGKHPSFQLFHDLVTMFNISVDEYFYPAKNVEKNTARRQIDSSLDLLSKKSFNVF